MPNGSAAVSEIDSARAKSASAKVVRLKHKFAKLRESRVLWEMEFAARFLT
jgi:hypothetical protein